LILGLEKEAIPFTPTILSNSHRMASKLFYLFGDAASTARPIDIRQSADFEELQQIVASHFAVVDPKGNRLSPVLITQ
jgi:hypothetical protein